MVEKNTTEKDPASALALIPTVVQKGQSVQIQGGADLNGTAIVVDGAGKIRASIQLNRTRVIQTTELSAGIYYLRLQLKGKQVVKKFVVVN